MVITKELKVKVGLLTCYYKFIEISEDLLREMCALSTLSKSNNTAKSSCHRPNNNTVVLCSTKNIQEDYEISLDNDEGTNRRPRFKEEIKLPPQYESIDLIDPNDEVLFQGELFKYKAGVNPSYLKCWI